jgi:hypothetical protein
VLRYLVLALVACAACAPKGELTPDIAISPGVEGRLALMDRYRLHDEERRMMMQRPHVWVEEAPEQAEEPDASASDAQ